MTWAVVNWLFNALRNYPEIAIFLALGCIASMESGPQKARILLMLGLSRTSDPKQLEQYFMEC